MFPGASVKYSVLYQLGLALPYVHFMFLIWVVFEIFTPILGRSGTEIPPDVVLATLVTLTTLFLSSFFVSRVVPWLILASFPKEGRGQEHQRMVFLTVVFVEITFP